MCSWGHAPAKKWSQSASQMLLTFFPLFMSLITILIILSWHWYTNKNHVAFLPSHQPLHFWVISVYLKEFCTLCFVYLEMSKGMLFHITMCYAAYAFPRSLRCHSVILRLHEIWGAAEHLFPNSAFFNCCSTSSRSGVVEWSPYEQAFSMVIVFSFISFILNWKIWTIALC